MSIFNIVADAIKPVANLIDELHTSGEEKDQARAELNKIENLFASTVLDYEKRLFEKQADIVMSEAKGESWLQRSWRPVTMLTFLVLVVFDQAGWLPQPLAPEMWALLKIGLGGYVIGRSAEKIVPAVVDKMKGGSNG